MFRKLIFIIGLVLLVAISLQSKSKAETTLNLKVAIDESIGQYPGLQRAKAAVDEADWKTVESRSLFLPSLTGQVNYLTNKRYTLVDIQQGPDLVSIPQVVPTTIYTLSARWNIFDGFSSTYKWLAADQGQQAAQDDLEWQRFQLERQTILAFYKWLAAKQIYEVAQQNFSALQDHLKDIESSKNVGLATQYDVLRTQVQVSEAQSELINSEDNIRAASDKMAELLGKDHEDRQVTGQLPVLPAQLVEKIETVNLSQRKDLESLSKKEQAGEYLHSSLNKHYIPKISLFADYNYYNNKNDDYKDRNAYRESYLVGVSLTWNLFEGFGSLARSEQSKAQALQLSKTLEQARLKSKTDLSFWKRRFTYYSSLYKAKLIDIQRSTEAVRLAKAGRKAGTRTNTETLDAQSDLNRSKAAQIHAQMGAIEALVNLELATGEKIYNFEN